MEWRLRKHLERKASLMEGGPANAEGAGGGGKGMWGRLLAKILDNVQVKTEFVARARGLGASEAERWLPSPEMCCPRMKPDSAGGFFPSI